MNALLLGIPISVAVLVSIRLISRLRGSRGAYSARERAKDLGLDVSEVNRDLPISNHARRAYEIKPGKCVEYLLPVPNYRLRWRLLQRFDPEDPNLSDGWYLDASNLPGPFSSAIAAVAEGWQEEFLELEGTARGIAAYWDEWGGAMQVDRLHAILVGLRDAT